ncbi:MAG: DUF4340 domain-containing protein [Planctomycetota bacterium]|nr:DUF4340 domain-containing protein [Planctomycetota bacterium]MDG2142699.1 DUF4340 domain-containing protein [Planctomycetota bacterium]
MALTRANLGLLLLVAALFVLRFFGAKTQVTNSGNQAAFGAFNPDQILRLTVEDPVDGIPLVLKRAAKNAPWLVEARGDFPALAYPVDNMLRVLANLREDSLVSEESSSHKLFGVTDETGTKLGLEAPGGLAWSFVLGDLARGAGGTRTYLRAGGEQRVYGANGLGAVTSDPRSWIAPSLVDFDATLVTQIELDIAGVSVVLKSNDKGIWRDTAKNLEAPRIPIEQLIGEASNLVLADISTTFFDAQAMGFDGEEVRVTLSGKPKVEGAFEPIVIILGANEGLMQRTQSNGGDRTRQYVRSGAWMRDDGKPWVGLVDSEAGGRFLTNVLTILSSIIQGS